MIEVWDKHLNKSGMYNPLGAPKVQLFNFHFKACQVVLQTLTFFKFSFMDNRWVIGNFRKKITWTYIAKNKLEVAFKLNMIDGPLAQRPMGNFIHYDFRKG